LKVYRAENKPAVGADLCT